MKVLLINNFHYRKGGSEAVYFNTAEVLREYGNEVVFFSYKNEKNLPCEQTPFFVDAGGKIKQLRSFFYNREAAHKLEELINVEHPDVAHVHLIWGGMSPSILEVLRQYKIPVVHTAHDYRMVCPAYLLKDGKGKPCERCKGGKFYNCTINRCSKGSIIESILMTMEMYKRNKRYNPTKMFSGVVFVSKFSMKKHIEFDPEFSNVRSRILYNCPGKQVKDSLDKSLDTFNNYYLFYGRLSAEKGVPTLIKAFEQLPQLQLKIVGTGPLEEELKTYCSNHNLNNIEFLGYKNGKDLFDIVARAKYVCVTSECYENNPMTIVEAYSLRTPVIGAAIGGISEVILDNETGFTFQSGNVNSLIVSLKKASRLEKGEYMEQKQRASDFANQNFSRECYYQGLLDLYKECINSK